MKRFEKLKHNPIELIKKWWPEANINHITYDPKLKDSERDYWRMESSGGDGTATFTIEMLQALVLPLMNKNTYFINTAPKKWKDIKYTIGNIKHARVYGVVELKCGGIYPGQKEACRIPVKCEYITN